MRSLVLDARMGFLLPIPSYSSECGWAFYFLFLPIHLNVAMALFTQCLHNRAQLKDLHD